MRKHIKNIALICAAACLFSMPARADDIKFEASLDRQKVGLGEAAQLGLSFRGTHSMPAPDIGNIDGLEIRYLGPSTMMTVIDGQVSSSITHMYTVLPLKPGQFQLGPFSFKYKGDTYASDAALLEVAEERVVPVQKTLEEAAVGGAELGDRIFVTLEVGKASAYVNELIPVKVKFYVNRLNAGDIQLPTFAQEGFSKIEFKEPKQYRERVRGLIYDVLEFNTNIFGTKPGDYKLGPVKIKCNLMTRKRLARVPSARDDFFNDPAMDSFDDFFTRYEKHSLELKSREAQILISPIPVEGRPKYFSGAVGDYQFIYSASPGKIKTGDPVTVTMTINGTGNFNTVLSPKLDNTESFKVYEGQVRTEERRKTFTQVLIPTTELVTQIPKAVFSYFDPDQKEFKVIAQGPIPLQVEKAKEELPSQVVGPVFSEGPAAARDTPKEDLARDIIYIKESPGRWLPKNYEIYKKRAFAVSLALPLALLILLYTMRARRDRVRRDSAYAARLAAFRYAKNGLRGLKRQLRPDDPKVFYETLFETLQGYLGNRFHIPPAGVTCAEIEHLAVAKGIDLDVLAKIKRLFEACDEMRFASSKVDVFRMRDNFKETEEVIRYLERKKV